MMAVCMLPLSLLTIPAAADAYSEADDGDLLYTANFNVDKLKGAWDGMTTITPSTDGASVTLKPSSNKKGATEGNSPADLSGFSIAGKAHTVVFTVTAENENQEVGFLPDDWVGFIVTPGKNSYRFVDTKGSNGTDVVLDEGTYAGTGALTQTYAVEFKSEGADTSARIVSYKLFVLINGEWTLACSVSAEDIAAAAGSFVAAEIVFSSAVFIPFPRHDPEVFDFFRHEFAIFRRSEKSGKRLRESDGKDLHFSILRLRKYPAVKIKRNRHIFIAAQHGAYGCKVFLISAFAAEIRGIDIQSERNGNAAVPGKNIQRRNGVFHTGIDMNSEQFHFFVQVSIAEQPDSHCIIAVSPPIRVQNKFPHY